ncbi:MAG: 50S ribosomal protein L4 [Candidatus Micrarchaeaceae archaeon]
MEANLYQTDGKIARRIELPKVFETEFRVDLVRRALLAEQSERYQPQGRYKYAGMETTATYVGRRGAFRTGRQLGIAIRPRQKLGGGAMGYVRRIPSSTKGRRAHPTKVEKRLVERINSKERLSAIESAIGASASAALKERLNLKINLPVVVDSSIEKFSKSKELMALFKNLNLLDEINLSHKPKLDAYRRNSKAKTRKFRKTALIVAKDSSNLEKAGRNIPGVDVCSVEKMSVSLLAPGAMPRLIIWSESAVNALAQMQNLVKK